MAPCPSCSRAGVNLLEPLPYPAKDTSCPTCHLYLSGECRNGDACTLFHVPCTLADEDFRPVSLSSGTRSSTAPPDKRTSTTTVRHGTEADPSLHLPAAPQDRHVRKIGGKMMTFGPGLVIEDVRDEWQGSALTLTRKKDTASLDFPAVFAFLKGCRAGRNLGFMRHLRTAAGEPCVEVVHANPDFVTRVITTNKRRRRDSIKPYHLAPATPQVPYSEIADFASVRCSWAVQEGNNRWNKVPTTMQLVREMLTQYGPVDTCSALARRVDDRNDCLITFQQATHARTAATSPLPLDMLTARLPKPASNSAPAELKVSRTYGVTVAVADSLYQAFKTDIQAATATFEKNGQHADNYSWTYDSADTGIPGFTYLELRGTTPAAVAAVRGELRAILQGEIVVDAKGAPLWAPAFLDPARAEFLRKLNDWCRTHLAAHAGLQRLTLRGTPEDRAHAAAALREEAAKHTTHPPRAAPAAAATAPDDAAPCEVCLSPIDAKEAAVHLPCAHAYHATCLQLQADDALRQPHFPLRCAACDHPLPFATLAARVAPRTFDLLLQRAADGLVARRERDLAACPTPNCGGVYHAVAGVVETLDCPECLEALCTHCRAPAHPGRTCGGQPEDRVQAVFDAYRAQKDVRCCPHCKTSIAKDGGCPHMWCTGCHQPFNWDQAK